MKPSFLTAACTSIALLLAGPTIAKSQDTTASPTAAAAPTKMRIAKPALWKISDEDTTIYLFGTIHMLPKDIDWYRGPLKDAFLSSEQLVIEMVEPNQATMAGIVMKGGMNPSGTTLRSMMSDSDRTKYEATMTQLGLPAESFDSMRPWLAAVSISMIPLMKQGYDLESGAEKVLQRERGDRPLSGLETAEQQIGFFANLPDAVGLSFLRGTVDDAGKTDELTPRMVNAWVKGDADTVGDFVNESMAESPELAAALLLNRNMNWAEWVEDRMEQPGVVFVAVGAGHLAGRYSLNTMLTAKGMKITRVQ